jgi:chromosome segregation ATPase
MRYAASGGYAISGSGGGGGGGSGSTYYSGSEAMESVNSLRKMVGRQFAQLDQGTVDVARRLGALEAAVAARLDALEAAAAALEARAAARLDALEARAAARLDALEARAAARLDALEASAARVEARLGRAEARLDSSEDIATKLKRTRKGSRYENPQQPLPVSCSEQARLRDRISVLC